MDMSLWGQAGTMFRDPAIVDISPTAVAQYVGPGWHWGANGPEMNVPPPPGWSVEFGSEIVGTGDGSSERPYVQHLIHDRGNGMFDVYYPDGRYWITSSAEGGSGLLQQATYSIIAAGLTAGIGEVVSVASAGGLASQAAEYANYVPTSAPTGASNVATVDYADYWDGDITPDLYQSASDDLLYWDGDITPDLYTGAPAAPVAPDYPIPDVQVVDTPFPDLYSTPPTAPAYPIPNVPGYGVPAAAGGSLTSIIQDATGAVREVGAAVLAVAQVTRAFNGVVNPATRTNVANPLNGTVNGARPPVGVMTITPDGGAVINNGDGTYTVISPDGTSVTKRYPSTLAPVGTVAGLDQKTLLLAALGLGAVFFVTQQDSKPSGANGHGHTRS